ncbi:thiosulfate reductase [bacterium]|nr:MAG: thiosulfate reductase [bacterium]
MEVRAKHPLAIRWFHWINFPVLALMIWSGLMILWSNSVFTFAGRPILSQEFLEHPLAWYDNLLGHLGRKPGDAPYTLSFRLAEGMWWHFAIAWLFGVNGALYAAYLLRSGEWRTLFPDRHSLKESIHVVLHDLHLSKRPLPRRKYNGAQRIAYTGVIVLGIGSLITGIAIYKPMQLSPLTQALGGYTAARFEHFWIMILFLGFFAVHVGQVLKTGWNNFRGMITGHELAPVESPLPEGEVAA